MRGMHVQSRIKAAAPETLAVLAVLAVPEVIPIMIATTLTTMMVVMMMMMMMTQGRTGWSGPALFFAGKLDVCLHSHRLLPQVRTSATAAWLSVLS